MNIRNIEISEIKVDFYEVDAGWIMFRINAGDQCFDGRFSEVFDPLPDFKKWLEAISIGVQQTSFDYDPEGDEIKFDFKKVCWDREVFSILDPYKNQRIYLKANVNRIQLVKALYLGLIKFYQSDKFISKEWEKEYIKERLCNTLKIGEKELITQMLEFDRKELGEFLFNIDPSYSISFPEAKDKNEECNLFEKSVIEGKDSVKDYEQVETPVEWNIPDDYDYWDKTRKEDFIIECINEETNGYSGSKLSEFRSELIGKYLYEN